MTINISRLEKDGSFKYDFDIKATKTNEDVRDLHLFCISVVKDLINNRFKLNEYGSMSYNFEKIDPEYMVDELDYLAFTIYGERKKLDDDLNELLK